jgi:hypothetical protein
VDAIEMLLERAADQLNRAVRELAQDFLATGRLAAEDGRYSPKRRRGARRAVNELAA